MKPILILTVCVLLLTACSSIASPQATPADSSQARRVVWIQDAQGKIAMETMPLYSGLYVFDPDTKTTGMPGGTALEMEGSAIPIVIYGMSANMTGSIYADYSNAIFEVGSFSASQTEPIRLAAQYTPDGTRAGIIQLDVKDLNELFISTDSVVFPNDQRVPDRKGPFVTLTFEFDPDMYGTFTVSRNGKEVERENLNSTESLSYLMERTRSEDDVIEWEVTGNNNFVLYQGTFGFPMRGAVEGLVQYLIVVSGDY